ncbi:MAG TPA: molybdopterin-dependent oxidoreductase [Verrucomicrobiota bacterium]|nr:molybdopterin-dependent oxidoreductase [Verrucomicrobiota bacterium]HNU51982.1 molybdopterin-dependent oxidoreductase [Verrucomicrobiota bacterium]
MPEPTDKPPAPAAETLAIKVNGQVALVPRLTADWKGQPVPTTMLQACAIAGVEVPHYCYHPRLPVAGNCRMCLVEFGTPALGPDRQPLRNPDGSVVIQKSPRPAIACATAVSPGMEIYTDTPAVRQMREGVLEFLLINHPLDCPICDQAGECKLQEYAVAFGPATSRFHEAKVPKPKQVDLGPRVVLDDERCILCTRCIRFTRDIVGDDALGILNRGGHNILATYPGRSFDNNYTLNTVDLCPVGALTSRDFRFQMRVWFLKETRSLCTSCGTGCNCLIGSRENHLYRYTPRDNDAVNRSWLCDYGRLNFRWIQRPDRLAQPAGTRLTRPDWETALHETIQALRQIPAGASAIIASARMTNEELYLTRLLAQRWGAPTDTLPRTGEADSLLLNADRNPNTVGARLLGLSANPPGSNLARFAQSIRTGQIRGLLVLGENVARHGLTPDLLAGLDALVVVDLLPNATTALAHYLLPGCATPEKRGTYTNVHGRVQRFFEAIDPPGTARPEIEILQAMLAGLTDRPAPGSVETVFNQMTLEIPAFGGLTWAGLGDGGKGIRQEPTA